MNAAKRALKSIRNLFPWCTRCYTSLWNSLGWIILPATNVTYVNFHNIKLLKMLFLKFNTLEIRHSVTNAIVRG